MRPCATRQLSASDSHCEQAHPAHHSSVMSAPRGSPKKAELSKSPCCAAPVCDWAACASEKLDMVALAASVGDKNELRLCNK